VLVDLKNYNMEVYGELNTEILTLGISLSAKPSGHHSDRFAPGYNSLKKTIAYCMGRLAKIEPGQCVIDPMMGVGTIPIAAAQIAKHAHYIGGDIDAEALKKAIRNIKEAGVSVDVIQWNVYKLPIKTGSIDVTLSDIPFGSVAIKKNQKIYPNLFREITRITKAGGKALILSLEEGLISRVIENNEYWNLLSHYPVEFGGNQAGLYLLQRTPKS